MTRWTLFFDGATEPKNPGGWMGWAWELHANGTVFNGNGIKPPSRWNTNNAAEWWGCGFGLAKARELIDGGFACPGLLIIGDSMLVTHQLTGSWRCNRTYLRRCRRRCLDLLIGIEWRCMWARRDFNKHCDELSKQLLVDRGVTVPNRPKKLRDNCHQGILLGPTGNVESVFTEPDDVERFINQQRCQHAGKASLL